MLLPLVLVLSPVLVLAEPMLYMFPTNPQLHPPSMYPNQQFMRGKVRDLPDSGVIYLNRIKPIGQEFAKEPVAKVEVSVQNVARQMAPSSFERYNSEEERAPARRPPTTTTAVPIAPVPDLPTSSSSSSSFGKKISEQKQAVQKTKAAHLTVPEEAELDMLLGDLMKNEKKAPLPKIGRSSGSKRHVGAYTPKVISFDGTARVEKPRARAYGSPVSVRLQPRRLYAEGSSSTRNQGPDFDPWERMGQ